MTGLVTLDGAPLAMRQGMRGTVVFQPANGQGSTLSGTINSAGKYELAAGSQLEVQPSVYWVSVSAVEIIPPTADHPEPTGRRVTPAKYASATDSGFRIDVSPGPNVVNLSLKSDEPPTNENGPENAPTPEPDVAKFGDMPGKSSK